MCATERTYLLLWWPANVRRALHDAYDPTGRLTSSQRGSSQTEALLSVTLKCLTPPMRAHAVTGTYVSYTAGGVSTRSSDLRRRACSVRSEFCSPRDATMAPPTAASSAAPGGSRTILTVVLNLPTCVQRSTIHSSQGPMWFPRSGLGVQSSSVIGGMCCARVFRRAYLSAVEPCWESRGWESRR